jgi:hypothetical protein
MGVIGSESKWRRFRLRLEHRGLYTQERIDEPYTLPHWPCRRVPGKQPAEIAVSVAAQLIAHYHAMRSEPHPGQRARAGNTAPAVTKDPSRLVAGGPDASQGRSPTNMSDMRFRPRSESTISSSRYINLLAERVGGRAIDCSDQWFASCDNLVKPGRGVFKEGEFHGERPVDGRLGIAAQLWSPVPPQRLDHDCVRSAPGIRRTHSRR